jgi:hypothetical protein
VHLSFDPCLSHLGTVDGHRDSRRATGLFGVGLEVNDDGVLARRERLIGRRVVSFEAEVVVVVANLALPQEQSEAGGVATEREQDAPAPPSGISTGTVIRWGTPTIFGAEPSGRRIIQG